MIKFTPFKHQLDVLELSKKIPSIGIFFEQGLGKTLASILILRDKYNKEGRVMRTLILSPSAVIYNWRKEILKFSKIKIEHIHVSSGSGAKRSKQLLEAVYDKVSATVSNNKIVSINYEALRNEGIFKTLVEWKPEIIICDESHMLKNHKAKQSKAVFAISKSATNIFILTGTPILNSPIDLFMQFKILDRGATLGSNFFVFRGKYFEDENARWAGKPGHFPKFVPIKSKFQELTDKIYSKSVRGLKKDCLDLPPLIVKTTYVDMSQEQKRLYTEMKRDFITYINDLEAEGKPKAVMAQLAVTKALRLQQIVCGFVATDEDEVIELKRVPRLMEIETLLSDLTPTHKVIVWCSFILNYSQIAKICDKLNIKYTKIIGGMTAKEKQIAVDGFNEEADVRVVIANRRAGGVGINLTASDYSIVYSRNFSLADELQSEARNHRKGSEIHEKIIKINLCAKGTIDELIDEALTKKLDISQSILDKRMCL